MYKKIMKDILGVPDSAFMKLPDTQEIITEKPVSHNFEYVSAFTPKILEEKIKAIIAKYKDQPILFFFEKHNADNVLFIKKLCDQNFKLKFTSVMTAEELQFTLVRITMQKNGVFVLLWIYGIRIDFKLQMNAHVVVIANGDLELTMDDVIQASGRGNRSQGDL